MSLLLWRQCLRTFAWRLIKLGRESFTDAAVLDVPEKAELTGQHPGHGSADGHRLSGWVLPW